jgi:uncharacterized protein (DUF1697 family)
MQYVAFLRAINITGRFVRMERLRRAFKELGFSNIETYIQSGNVSFETENPDIAAIENQIEYGLQGTLGFPVPTFVRTTRQLIEIADYQPFPELAIEDDPTQYVVFLHQDPSELLQQTLLEQTNEIDLLHFYQNHIFWLYNRGRGESTLSNAKIEKTLRVPATLRNISTLQKIAAKYR